MLGEAGGGDGEHREERCRESAELVIGEVDGQWVLTLVDGFAEVKELLHADEGLS